MIIPLQNNILRCKLTVRKLCAIQFVGYSVRELRLNEFHVLMAASLLLQYIEQTNNFTSTYPLDARDLYVEVCIHRFPEGSEKSLSRKSPPAQSERREKERES